MSVREALEYIATRPADYLPDGVRNAALEALKELSMNLPDIELVSAKVHEAWMDGKRAKGVESRKSETGEELMVPYEQLSEAAKDLDRGSVQAVYRAIEALG
jgi:hypothetical protein